VTRRYNGSWSSIGIGSAGWDLSIQAALAAQGRELVVVDWAEVDDDLVRDMTEILTSMCARLCGKRGAQNRAKRAVAAVAADDRAAA
jgi:predicted site-specific integrase-resolvase